MLQNDSSSFVVASSGSFCKVKKRRGEDKKVGVLVSVTPAQLEFLDLDALMNESKIA
ncbi:MULTISPECIES: hypothetical protein [Nostocales]|uniref:hypothetical protein n=1 Tax=Nostocales TaxID=1161 RepID=UPI000A7849B3